MRVVGFGDKGMKAFYSATVLEGGTIVRVFFNKMEPAQNW